MAKGFTPENFLKVKRGMDEQQVEALVGKPLFIDSSDNFKIIHRYTNDGKLFYKDVPWYRCNDYAWRDQKVFFDSKMIVTKTSSAWCYD